MKVSLRWLADYIDLPTDDPARIRAAFESLGHEVEGVERLAPEWSGVVVARVEDVAPHPDADKVRVCRVEAGEGPVTVVCGAWNFEAGATVAFARPGAVLPGGFEIGRRTIRGVESNGMICSERELGIGDDHTGILVLDAGSPGDEVGPLVGLPDIVFDLAITPNRPDAMSMVGIARELGAFFAVPFRVPEPALDPVPGAPAVGVDIADPSGCLRFVLREVDGLAVGPSPLWMRRRLRAAGVRPISNVVDVTNYVMLELGHPLHAFDADRLSGDRLVVRRAERGERLVTLDGVERTLDPSDIVICDAGGPTSLAGTMGGAASEVVDGTSRVLIEAATWDPPSIMATSRRHGLRSEASSRFERGVDPGLPLLASARAAELAVATGGGRLLAGVVDEVVRAPEEVVVSLPLRLVERTLGSRLEAAEIRSLLGRIGLAATGDDPLSVLVPTFRPDVTRPVDVVEEIARLAGYETFPDELPTGAGGGWSPSQRRVRAAREALVGAGVSEAVNLSFVSVDDVAAFRFPDDDPRRAVVEVRNPLRDEEALLRTTLLPGLLRALRSNVARGLGSAALFEIGKVFFRRPDPADPRIPEQPDRLSFAVTGGFGEGDLAGASRPADAYTATALWRVLAARLGLDPALRPARAPGFHPGRCAEVLVGGEVAGVIGEIHPETAAAFGLTGRVAAGELDLALLARPLPPRLVAAPSPYPPVEFDLAFFVPDTLAAAELEAATAAAGGALLESATVFDEYRPGGGDRRSLALRYVLRAPDRTLAGDEVAGVREAMIAAAAALGAELRGAG